VKNHFVGSSFLVVRPILWRAMDIDEYTKKKQGFGKVYPDHGSGKNCREAINTIRIVSHSFSIKIA